MNVVHGRKVDISLPDTGWKVLESQETSGVEKTFVTRVVTDTVGQYPDLSYTERVISFEIEIFTGGGKAALASDYIIERSNGGIIYKYYGVVDRRMNQSMIWCGLSKSADGIQISTTGLFKAGFGEAMAMTIFESIRVNKDAAQQVDSAEASTITVPPSDPSGSPR